MMSSTTDLTRENQVAPAEDNMANSPDVAYRPVTMDTSFEVDDSTSKPPPTKGLQKTVIIIIVTIFFCIVIAAIVTVVVTKRERSEPFEYRIIQTNLSADLYVTEYPDNATIEIDIENSIDELYHDSVFKEVYNQTIVENVSRGTTETEISLLMIFSDLGDHLGSPTGASDEPTDVVDLFQIALSNNSIRGFVVSNYRYEQSS